MSSKIGRERFALSPRPRSLAIRLTAWYGLSAFVLIAGATGFLYWALITNLDREDDEFLADKVHILRSLLRDRPNDARMLQEEVEWEPAARQYGQVYVRILDSTGRSITETPGMSKLLPGEIFPATGADDADAGRGSEVTLSTGASFRILAAPAAFGASGSRAAVIQVALDRTREETLLAQYRRSLWLALAVALIVCVVTGYQIARRGLRPVAEITKAACRIRSTTLHERIEARRFPTELSVLAERFNEMLDRLEESFDRLARFSADIAHELRTPVNNLRGEAEVALGKSRAPQEYREVLGSCLEECGRLSRMIDSLLFLARAESPQTQIVRERVDLGKELSALGDFYEASAADAGVRLAVNVPKTIFGNLERSLFQRAVGNLLANALAHTPPGGAVILAAARENGGVLVEVSDTGSGIAADHLPYVFDRFYRADLARSSGTGRVGLGLAIVKSIAALHGGAVSISSELGRGTRVLLRFPD
jgi:two-component system heavy metal sensor histidine kinase CusS